MLFRFRIFQTLFAFKQQQRKWLIWDVMWNSWECPSHSAENTGFYRSGSMTAYRFRLKPVAKFEDRCRNLCTFSKVSKSSSYTNSRFFITTNSLLHKIYVIFLNYFSRRKLTTINVRHKGLIKIRLNWNMRLIFKNYFASLTAANYRNFSVQLRSYIW